MQNTVALIYFGCFIAVLHVLSISANVEYTKTLDTKADRSPVGYVTKLTLSKDRITAEKSEKGFAKFSTTLSQTNATVYTELPSTTVLPGLDVNSEFFRSYGITLTTFFGMFFLILLFMLITGCLKINVDFCCDYCGRHCESGKPTESVEYSLSELTLVSLEGRINQENDESETRTTSDLIPERILDPVNDGTDSRSFYV